MNVELRFLQKAIEDRNYISFFYKNKKVNNIKPLKLTKKDRNYYLHTQDEIFDFDEVKRIQISKERF